MIVYKYLDVKGAVDTLKNPSILLRHPEEYSDDLDSYFDPSDDEYRNAYRLYKNYLMFIAIYEEVFCNKTKPISLKSIMKPFVLTIREEMKLIKRNKRFKEQTYLNCFNTFIHRYLGKKEKELKLEFKNAIRGSLNNVRKQFFVSCFCESNKEEFMWDRYAYKSSGICVAFDVEDNKCKKVKYGKRPVNYKLTKIMEFVLGHMIAKCEAQEDSKYDFMLNPFFFKSKNYSIEKELRMLFSSKKTNENYFYKVINGKTETLYKMDSIRAIYLGTRVDKKILSTLKNLKIDYPVYQMMRKKGSYEYDVQTLDVKNM